MAENTNEPVIAYRSLGLLDEPNENNDSTQIIVRNTITGRMDYVDKSSLSGGSQDLQSVLNEGSVAEVNATVSVTIPADEGVSVGSHLALGGNNIDMNVGDNEFNLTENYLSTTNQLYANGGLNGFDDEKGVLGKKIVLSNSATSPYENAAEISHSNTADRLYTLPDESGTIAMVEYDLPVNFFLSNNYDSTTDNSNNMYYFTDSFRPLDLSTAVGPNGAYATYETSIIDKNTIAIVGQFHNPGQADPGTGDYFILMLDGCKIVNNLLTFESYRIQSLPDIKRNTSTNVPYNIHSMVYHRDFLYLSTRVSGNVTDNSQVIKINPWDVSDVKYLTLPTTSGYDNSIGKMLAYKDNLYLLGVRNTGTLYASFIRVSENLSNYEILFQCGNVTDAKRVGNSSPFQIYNDKVYIPYRYIGANTTLANNTVGFFVYDLFKGTQIIDTGNITISSDGTGRPLPHWMFIFNGKILMHTASGNVGGNWRLLRFDVETMAFEAASQLLPNKITNNNTVTRDGYVLLNTEASSTGWLYKINYDFTEGQSFEQTGFEGWYSLGSTEYVEVYKESLKTKLSDFKNDLPTTGGTVTNVSGASGKITVTNPTTTPVIDIDTAYDATLVHKTGDETIAGNKSLTGVTTITNAAVPFMTVRTNTGTNTAFSAFGLKSKTSNTIADDFGVLFSMQIEGIDNVQNTIVQLVAQRQNGSNTSGGFTVRVFNAGVAFDAFSIAYNGVATAKGALRAALAPVAATDVIRKTELDAMNIVNDTSTAFTKATLNSTYPSAVPGARIICKNVGSGMIYTKASGTDWLSTSAVLMT